MPLDDRFSYNSKDPYNIAAPKIPESSPRSLKAAGRAFSFGRKKADSQVAAAPAPRLVDLEHSNGNTTFQRPRAMTESSYASESTATPSNFLNGGLDLGQSDDDFGAMFDNIGKRQSKSIDEPQALTGARTESPVSEESTKRASFTKVTQQEMSPVGTAVPDKNFTGNRMQDTPSPIHPDLQLEMQDSPRSWASGDSQDGLISNKTQKAADALSYYRRKSPEIQVNQGLSKSRTVPPTGPTSPSHRKTQPRTSLAGGGLRRSSVYVEKRDPKRASDTMQDADARLVLDSLNASQTLSEGLTATQDSDEEADNSKMSLIPDSYPSPYTGSESTPPYQDRRQSPGPLFDSSDRDFSVTPWRQGSNETTPRAKKTSLAHHEERSLFDASPPPAGRSAPPPPRPQAAPQLQKQNKVMTPLQFEKYRKEQEAMRNQYFHNDDSDEEGDDNEDEDEIERNKHLARERKKQEAHLSVYRQQMMKVTGEQPSDLPRPGLDRASMSAPAAGNRSHTPTFSFDTPAEADKVSEDEDEDIPLGVLAAHGFPSKNRPPTANSSKIQYKSESYPPPPMSTAGGPSAGAASGLPPFAKRLPQDPYYGAGLVNPANRESLAFGHGGPSSSYGGSGSVHGGAPPSPHPSGLVGVIAGEERARAARRGSPNAQGQYGAPPPPGMMPPSMGMPPMISPGEQATMQMSEQMNQMMQMQMQWMQQMQQMMGQGMQGMPAGQQPPFAMPPQQQQMMMMMNNAGMLGPPGQQQRPISQGAPTGPPPPNQRTRSMVNPTPQPGWQMPNNNRMSKAPSMMSGALGGQGPGYASSLAPSERSNVGMPSRYRPVSIAPKDEHESRASGRSSTFTSGALHPGESGRNSRMSTSGDRQSKLSLRPASAMKKNTASDDDEEEGWEEMKAKREKKKSAWRLRKQQDEQGALDVYDYPEL